MLPNVVAGRALRALPPRSRPSLIPQRVMRYSPSSFSSLPPLPSPNESARPQSRLPRARPSPTGSIDQNGSAVPAATQVSTRRRSLKPALESILKPSASTKIACRPTSACAGPIDYTRKSGLCKASAEVYAASWRSFPAQEWDNDKLPIERSDRSALRRKQIEKRELLADGGRPRKVEFAQTRRCRIVFRWIEDPR